MSNNTPTLYAYAVKERGKRQKAIWTRIGAAWSHENSGGFTLELEALPINFDGRLVLMPPKATGDKPADTFEAEAEQV